MHNKTVKFACAKNAHAWTPLTLRHLPRRYVAVNLAQKHLINYIKICKYELNQKQVKAAENNDRIKSTK